ncbi:hypothetical protein EDD18DRAFT_1358632 [Armillaria luteobubalina]|uniref:Uncharacterized protein n=1 Tax=Armillaria luteobubalina TaxID=153913 RepID=A0AA39U9X8_9AGAR|nr:hypothetical protein EDD18DRAFT_1364654 [Armillaria luteobubalina]KAK0491837.1 hypothetical protein EDD18DRAFT_1358632 [Armillaria luteobubalina]
MTSTVDAGGLSRAAQRKQRLLEIENEQRMEDVEALRMTEEQRQVLLRSFATVTSEFFPLDGLQWTPVSLHKRIQVMKRVATKETATTTTTSDDRLASPSPPALASITNATLGTAEDTIRVSSTSLSAFLTSYYASPSRTGERSRSPVKGLFTEEDEKPTLSGADESTVRGRICRKSGTTVPAPISTSATPLDDEELRTPIAPSHPISFEQTPPSFQQLNYTPCPSRKRRLDESPSAGAKRLHPA